MKEGGCSERDAAALPSADSPLLPPTSCLHRRRRESPRFTVTRPDGVTAGPERFSARQPGDTAASLRSG